MIGCGQKNKCFVEMMKLFKHCYSLVKKKNKEKRKERCDLIQYEKVCNTGQNFDT